MKQLHIYMIIVSLVMLAGCKSYTGTVSVVVNKVVEEDVHTAEPALKRVVMEEREDVVNQIMKAVQQKKKVAGVDVEKATAQYEIQIVYPNEKSDHYFVWVDVEKGEVRVLQGNVMYELEDEAEETLLQIFYEYKEGQQLVWGIFPSVLV
ncbi:hypothetical protein BAMA_03405 [Bacillus manliponensis]|uniref:YhfM-like domain-containing protein n=1 Tax=Bacillus manliponensis TaxID=574376 RepID=A0A073JX25_9BACI|nr:hypothetical protein [Bacillus manliponensis]KEK18835.1 hypothetical protein BAMA_03405 [Bacillus manliponensis]